MLSLILGRAGTGKTLRVMENMKRRAETGETGLMLIVPEQYSHNAERRLCDVCGSMMSLHGEVLSFSRLCSRVFAQVGSPAGTPVDDGGRILIMHRAIQAVAPALKLYGAGEKRVEFLSNMLKMAEEFKTSGVLPSELYAASEFAAGVLKDKLHDLSLIIDAYDSFFDEKTANPRDRLTYLSQVIEQSEIIRHGRIYIDGFTDFTAQEMLIVEKLIKMTDLTVCLTCPGLDCDEEVFALPVKTAGRLIRTAEKHNVQYEISILEEMDKNRPQELIHMERELFSDTAEGYKGENHAISLCRTLSVSDEYEYASYVILKLLRSGYRRRDIAVAACDWSENGALMENIFEKYGIPVYLSRKTDILQKAPLLAATAVLDIINSGWEYDDVFRYLKTGLCGISQEECDEIENYVLTWDIRGTLWTRGEGWTLSPSGYEGEADENALERINGIRRRIVTPVLRLERRLKDAENAGEQIAGLYDFFEDIGLPEQLERKAEEFLKNGWLQLRDEYIQLWDILKSAMEQYYAIMQSEPADLKEFIKLWPLMLSQYDIASIPVSLDTVGIGDIARHRRPGVKCLIVTGASEDKLPKIPDGGGVFSDSERSAMITLGIDISGTAEERASRELYGVYSALTMASEQLIMTYHAGGEKRPSRIFIQLGDMFNIECKIADNAKSRTAALAPCFELASAGKNQILRDYFTKFPEYSQKLEAIKNAASADRGRLSEETAKKLYGDRIFMSASRVDRYYYCSFSHFMQYGLKAKPRRPAGFDAPQAGIFMHYLLENVTKEAHDGGGFKCITEEDCRSLVKKYTEKFISERLNGFKDKSPRFVYLFNRLVRDSVAVVWEMAQELRDSDFEPIDFELNFSEGKGLHPITLQDGQVQIRIGGVVDRVDGWVHNGKIYLRVVDYKTGRKSFSLSDVWYGLGMQMLIYLFALEKEKKYGAEVVPASVLYTPARDTILTVPRNSSDDEIEKLRAKDLKRTGIILDDEDVIAAMGHGESAKFLPVRFTKEGRAVGESLASLEKLGCLSKHVEKMLLEIGRELSTGSIEAAPFYKSPQDNACVFCQYKNACRFSEDNGDRKRYLKKLKTDDVWKKIMEEAENEQN